MMRPPRGLTLVELMVAVAILGVMLALFLSAVMRARETARRAQCVTHLHNVGVALHHFQESRGEYPAGSESTSFLLMLLPYIEQERLVRVAADPRTSAVPIPGTYVCPSDPRGAFMSRFATSYAGNAGVLGRGKPLSWEGVFTVPVNPRDVSDGLSRTVAVSEWIVGDGDYWRESRLGSIHLLSGDFAGMEAGQKSFLEACTELEPPVWSPPDMRFKGSSWFRGKLGYSLYTHALPPNRPSCRAAPDLNAITAGSLHGGGCNALFLDGSVRFIRDTVDESVWQALGTRAGGEVVGENSY